MVRTAVEILLVILLAVAGITWWNTKNDRDAQKDRASRYEQNLEEAVQHSDSLEVALAELDSISATQDSAHATEISEAETVINEQSSRADSLLQVILNQVPDSTRRVVQALHNSYKVQLSHKDRIIESLEHQVAIRNTRILARDELISSLQEGVRRATELAAFWEKEANPSFTLRLKKNVGLITTSALIGAAVTLAVSN